jgi:hypothetical protein
VPCKLEIQSADGWTKCDWTDVAVGDYRIIVALDQYDLLTKSFSVAPPVFGEFAL